MIDGPVRALGSQLIRVIQSPSYWVLALMFTAFAVMTRLWFFTDFPVPSFVGDSEGYFELARMIDAGAWPEFGIRPPGYPLFLAAVFAINDSLMALMVAQNLLTLAACLALIYAFHAYRPWLGIWAAAGLAVFVSGIWSFDCDTSVLSDGVYSSVIMLAFALLMLAILRGSAAALGASSTLMGVAILVRPAGMFLLVIYLICLLFLVRNRAGAWRVVAFATPLPALLLALCTYNFVTIRTFALSEFGEVNIAMATMTFWSEDPRYPQKVNGAIRSARAVIDEQLTQEERELVTSSWDYPRLGPVFLKGFNWAALGAAVAHHGGTYRESRGWLRTVAFDSIRKQPTLYMKFVATQMWLQYVFNIRYQIDFAAFIRNRIAALYLTDTYTPGVGTPAHVAIAKEYALKPTTPSFFLIRHGVAQPVPVLHDLSMSRAFYLDLIDFRREFFARGFWVVVFAVGLLLSAVRLARSGFRHRGAFVAFVLTISVFGASLLIALVEYGGYRYSFVMEYVYYLPIIPLIFMRPPVEAGRYT